MAVYEHLAHNKPPPWELTRLQFVERFSWSFEQFDNMSYNDYFRIKDIDAGRALARRELLRKKQGE